MRSHLGLGIFTFLMAGLAGESLAHAAVASCMSTDGTCEVSNAGFDTLDCMCADGSALVFGGGNEWAGLSEAELQPICDAELALWCGPPMPPDGGIPCSAPLGDCTIDNDPIDHVYCQCSDGSSVNTGGNGQWAGYSEAELLAECELQIDLYCAPPPPPPAGLMCSNANGECLISNVPEDFIECMCTSGDGFGMGGGMAWGGYSDMELLAECESQLVGFCGGPPPPPPPPLECSSRLGSCMIGNDPIDFLECTCAEGDGFTGGGGMEWAELSEDELLMMCEETLAEGCAVDGTTGEPEGTTGDDETTGDSTEGSSTGSELPDTDGVAEGTTGTQPEPGTTGPGATDGEATDGEATDGTDGGAPGADDGGGGCGCSVPRSSTPGWALLLMGLAVLRRRRRRAA